MLAQVARIAVLATVLASTGGCIIHHHDDGHYGYRSGWDSHHGYDDRDRDRYRKGHR